MLGAGPLPGLAVGVRRKLAGRGGLRRVSRYFARGMQGPSRPLRARPPSRRRYVDGTPALGAMLNAHAMLDAAPSTPTEGGQRARGWVPPKLGHRAQRGLTFRGALAEVFSSCLKHGPLPAPSPLAALSAAPWTRALHEGWLRGAYDAWPSPRRSRSVSFSPAAKSTTSTARRSAWEWWTSPIRTSAGST